MRIPEKYFAFLPLLLMCAFFVYQSAGLQIHDFANYYFGGLFLGNHHFPTDIYFPYWFNKEITAINHQTFFAGFAPNTPFLALLIYPLTALPLAAAKLVFNCISVLLFLHSVRRLVDFYGIPPVYLLLLPVLFFIPLRNEIYFGQVYLLLFFFLAEYWLAYEKGQWIKASVFLALAILLKVFPALLLVIFLFKKQWKPFGYTLAICVALVLLTVVFCGFDLWVFYLKSVLSKASNGGIASAYVENYQSVFMFLKRLFVFDVTENPGGFFYQPSLFAGLLSAFKIAVLGIGFYITRKAPEPLLVFSYWILAMILLSPYGSTYTFVLMLFPFFALAKQRDLPIAKKALLLVLLFLVCNFPISVFMHLVFPLSYLRLFGLLLFFGMLLSLMHKTVNWKMVSGIAAIALLAIICFNRNGQPGSAYLLGPKTPLLIHDYKIENNRLTYIFWDLEGENTASFPLKASRIENADLTQNEIYFFGKKIPSDSGNKLKPMVIDGKTLVYLSDYDRGIGFYTLRKIRLDE